jgi:hypothetical protein
MMEGFGHWNKTSAAKAGFQRVRFGTVETVP